MATIRVIKGDITQQAVDAIVNAANPGLLGGGGVDGAIHRAAVRELLIECRTLNGCQPGDAKLTKGYRYRPNTSFTPWGRSGGVASTVNPTGGLHRRSLELVAERSLTSIAFPTISTGVCGYPKDKAADVALAAVNHFLQQPTSVREVIFVCFNAENYHLYTERVRRGV